MKFMIEWHIPTTSYKVAAERFLATHAPDPDGLETIGRWHAPGSARGWHAVEGDAAAIAELVATWGDSVELEITPVLEDADAAAGLGKVYGK